MGRLVYCAIASLDGCIEDAHGEFRGLTPDVEVFQFVNELMRGAGTYLYGRRMYETMLYWETVPLDENVPAFEREFTEMWRAAEKVVYSRTLNSPSSARTRLERSFDPDAVRRLKQATSRDLTVAGADLAGQALAEGLVDELQVIVVPTILGGGKPWLPKHVHLDLELQETRRFSRGDVFLRYRPKAAVASSAR